MITFESKSAVLLKPQSYKDTARALRALLIEMQIINTIPRGLGEQLRILDWSLYTYAKDGTLRLTLFNSHLTDPTLFYMTIATANPKVDRLSAKTYLRELPDLTDKWYDKLANSAKHDKLTLKIDGKIATPYPMTIQEMLTHDYLYTSDIARYDHDNTLEFFDQNNQKLPTAFLDMRHSWALAEELNKYEISNIRRIHV